MFCSEEQFEHESVYQRNLNHLLANLSSEAVSKKFYNSTEGDGVNKVYGLFLCNAAYTAQLCQDCITVAAGQVQQKCPYDVDAIVFYGQCMLRYANHPIFSIEDDSVHFSFEYGPRIYKEFDQQLSSILIDLFNKAIADNASLAYASGVVYVRETISLVAYVDCTPDLSPYDCNRCLQVGLNRLPMNGRQIGTTVQPSCRLSYFYFDVSPGKRFGASYIALTTVASIAGISFILNFYLCFRKSKERGKPTGLEEIESLETLHLKFSSIKVATDNFASANKIGRVGFGIVYMGTLPDGQAISVKRLASPSGQGIREFKSEACLVAKLQHKNLVKLFGFCLEGDEKLLVYEFVPNKSLDLFLFDTNRGVHLRWETRQQIIMGIVRGLLYLHEDSRFRIIHRDLKPGNILLDEELNPKIADFGMAKLFGVDQTQGNTSRVSGTFGYMAPEYVSTGKFSVKSDVFSFGVILLEIVSGHRNSVSELKEEDENLLNHAWRLWNDGTALKLVDPNLGGNYLIPEVTRCIHIGLLCVQEDAARRPTMGLILSMLSSLSVVLPSLTAPPAFPYRRNMPQALSESNARFTEVFTTMQGSTVVTCELPFVVTLVVTDDQVTFMQQFCSEEGHYDHEKIYQSNLNLLLSNLSFEAVTKKFYNFTVGEGSNKVYGLFLCVGTYTAQLCQDCITEAVGQVQQKCPNHVAAIVFYGQCMLRYANRSIFSIEDDFVYFNYEYGPPGYKQFDQPLSSMLIDLSNKAKVNNMSLAYAMGSVYVSENVILSAYADCTPDLTPSECNKCFRTGLNRLPMNGKQLGTTVQPSCRLQYLFVDFNQGISFILNFYVCFRKFKARGKPTGIEEIESMENLHLQFDVIKVATDNFSPENKIGRGGFGVVYMGTLADGQAIAVKRLASPSGQGIREFKSEACLAAKLQHKNLVKLYRFCLEGEEKLLVYEFVPNKSLDRFLYGTTRGVHLKWETRQRIVMGIARGLLYLHEDSRFRIIHRDLKPSNILLDGEMNPKIADFGMARLFEVDQTQGNTSRVAGTFGYMAPEYASTGNFSVKSDVFSFGVLLLEIVSGRRNSVTDLNIEDENLLNHAWKCWNDGTGLELVDPNLGGNFSIPEIERYIHIGLLCVQEDAARRPAIASILSMLSSQSAVLPSLTAPPAFPYQRNLPQALSASNAHFTEVFTNVNGR
uniref:Uncharacterized protein n=1 Tax=Chenopodium quinoa TaxID=63459 RepID=A0A803LKU4_CHEQI